MKLSYRKAVNDDADLLIDIYNSSFMMTVFGMENVLPMEKRKKKWNYPSKILPNIL